jgi:hypothetical protein
VIRVFQQGDSNRQDVSVVRKPDMNASTASEHSCACAVHLLIDDGRHRPAAAGSGRT